MTIISLPSAFKIRRAEWSLRRPAQVNRSTYSGRRRVVASPWHSLWTANVELVPLEAADDAAVRAMVAALQGQINTVRLPAIYEVQSAASVVVNGTHAAGVRTLATEGWTPSTLALPAGAYFEVGDQLCVLTAAANANGSGQANLAFEPPLRSAAADGTAVNVGEPTALMALLEDTVRWSIQAGPLTSYNFQFEEAY